MSMIDVFGSKWAQILATVAFVGILITEQLSMIGGIALILLWFVFGICQYVQGLREGSEIK